MANKIISILVAPNCDMEALAIRSVLEYFGFTVILRLIGRPKDLTNILQGDQTTKMSTFLIFCFHGQNGKFVMPKLATEIYEPNEPKGNFDFERIKQYANLNGQYILTTGCTLGNRKLAESFLKCNAKSYIGPKKYPEGNSAIAFITMFFYAIIQGDNHAVAFEKAKNIDDETRLFEKYE